jgi:hypothetical protein
MQGRFRYHNLVAMPRPPKTSQTDIAGRIIVIRGQRVLLDSDLALLYGVATKRFNEQVRRNAARFPADFMFQLNAAEMSVLRSQFATSKVEMDGRGGRRYLPHAFTGHGAIRAATVLNTQRAVQMTVYVVRAFLKLRQLLASNEDLARKLEDLEKSIASLDESTRQKFEEVYGAIRALMRPPDPPSRPIGFTVPVV